jgi:hypothetical protein
MSEEIERLNKLVTFAETLDQQVADAEAVLKDLKSKRYDLHTNTLPQLMQEFEFTKIETDHHTLKLEDVYTGNIPKHKMQAVVDYAIHELDVPEIVKHVYTFEFDLDDDEHRRKFEAAINAMQEPYIHDRRVNTSTMKRVVKELHNKGELIDWERTGVTRVKQVTIKRRN